MAVLLQDKCMYFTLVYCYEVIIASIALLLDVCLSPALRYLELETETLKQVMSIQLHAQSNPMHLLIGDSMIDLAMFYYFYSSFLMT